MQVAHAQAFVHIINIKKNPIKSFTFIVLTVYLIR